MRTGSVSVDVRDEDDERKKTTKRAIVEGTEKNCAFARREKRVRPPPSPLVLFRTKRLGKNAALSIITLDDQLPG